MDLVYEKYTAKSLVVRGDRETYNKLIIQLGGTWNPRLKKNGVITPGWLVPISYEDKIQKLIKSTKKDGEIEKMAKSKKDHKSYKFAGLAT